MVNLSNTNFPLCSLKGSDLSIGDVQLIIN